MYVEVGRLTKKKAGHPDRACRSSQGRDGDPQVEAAQKFFQHKHGARDRRVECRSESGSCTGRQKRLAFILVAAAYSPEKMSHTCSHLHTGPLAAQCQAGAHREETAEEFNRNDAQGTARPFPIYLRLYVRDAAARSLW